MPDQPVVQRHEIGSMHNFGEKVTFIWSVADLLRDAFKRSKYPDVNRMSTGSHTSATVRVGNPIREAITFNRFAPSATARRYCYSVGPSPSASIPSSKHARLRCSVVMASSPSDRHTR